MLFWYTIGFYRVGFELFGTTTSVKEMNAIASVLKIDLCDANYEEPNWEPKDVLLLLTVAKNCTMQLQFVKTTTHCTHARSLHTTNRSIIFFNSALSSRKTPPAV